MGQLTIGLLAAGEVGRIHDMSLKILREAGCKVDDAQTREVLRRAGAHVDEAAWIVHLPPELVTSAVNMALKVVRLHRADEQVLDVGRYRCHYRSIVTDPFILDYDEGERRPRLSDIARHARLGDALPQISFMYKMDMMCTDVPESLTDPKTLEALMTNTTKHFLGFPANMESVA